MHISNGAAKYSNDGENELREMQNQGHENCILKKKKKKEDRWRNGIWYVLGFCFSFFCLML